MNLTFKRSSNLLFVEQSGPEIEVEGIVDIILAPSFYWVKRQELPVKYVRDVKKLLPSIFDETIPEGKYSYSAYKSGEHFVMMAYKDKEILDALAERGLKSSQIGKIFLAQSEFEFSENALLTSQNSALAIDNGIVVEVPSILVPEAQELDLKVHKVSKHTIELVRYAHIVDTKSIYKMAAIIAVLVLLVGVEYGMVSSKISMFESQQEDVFTKYKLPSTMFENEALLKKLEKRFSRQKKLRHAMYKVYSMSLTSDEYISYMEKKKKTLFVEVELSSKSRANALFAYLKKEGVKLSYNMKRNRMRMEIAL